jgi:hypothetical protein
MTPLIKIRVWYAAFIVALFLSGITAFPLEWELSILNNYFGPETSFGQTYPSFSEWINRVYKGISETNNKFPFMAYGTDWLAFAHIVLAILFIGPFINPVKNIWVTQFGLISCVLVFPLAFICGSIRGIPFYWQLIDCSFGLLGAIPLLIILHLTKKTI